jgi:hypothetical protein
LRLPLGLLYLLGLPLGPLCLLGFISTLSLSGYVSSTLSALTMPVYWYASWAPFAFWAILPLWACLLGPFASWSLYRHLASQAMSHRHCLFWQCRYTNMPLGLCHRWTLVSMQKW